MADFACYVVLYPRDARKDGECNLGSTAVSYVAHVRSWYEGHLRPPRRPGSGYVWNQHDHLGATLRRCLDGLRKLHPSVKEKSRPIERHVMVKLARRLRRGDRWQRTKWAIYAICWQAGRRNTGQHAHGIFGKVTAIHAQFKNTIGTGKAGFYGHARGMIFN